MQIVDSHLIAKTYAGLEPALRGTKLEANGPALWVRNLVMVARLTASAAAAVRALEDVCLHFAARCGMPGA